MKRHLWIASSLAAIVVFAGSAGAGQDRGRENDRRDDGGRQQNEHYQDRRGEYRFNNHDRQATRDWYNHRPNRSDRGFRDSDRLAPDYESQIRTGVVLNPELRRRSYAIPYELRRRLAPAPRGYRYIVVSGHVVLVDDGYRVYDVVHLELNF